MGERTYRIAHNGYCVAGSLSETPPPIPTVEDAHLKLAYELTLQESGLGKLVLYNLLGRPRRYKELKELLGERRDHNLTVALQSLQRSGLIDRRTSARTRPVVHTYEITPLGIQVVLAMQTIRPLQESLEIFRKAQG